MKKEKTAKSHDYLLAESPYMVINAWLKVVIAVLSLVVIILSIGLVVKTAQVNKENIIPIVINEATGDAYATNFNVVDPAGESRAPVFENTFSNIINIIQSGKGFRKADTFAEGREAARLPIENFLINPSAPSGAANF